MHTVAPWVTFFATLIAGMYGLSFLGHLYGEKLEDLFDSWWGTPTVVLIVLTAILAAIFIALMAGQLVFVVTA